MSQSGNGLSKTDAMAAKHLLQVINEPFRNAGNQLIQWEPMLIFRRLLLVIVNTFIIGAITKLYPIGMLLIMYLVHHTFVQPYKDEFLNYVETMSLGLLCCLSMINMFWAFSDQLDISESSYMKMIGMVFLYLEMLILMLPFLSGILYVVITWFRKCVQKKCLGKQD